MMGIFSVFTAGGSGGSKIEENDSLLKELPESQRTYFLKKDAKLEVESKQEDYSSNPTSDLAVRVVRTESDMKKLSAKEAQDLEAYKQVNTRRAAVLENCSEIQMLLLQCLKHGDFKEKLSLCNTRTNAMFNCIDAQKKALSALGYESARSIDEAVHIKGISDDLFVKNFGQDGLNVSEESTQSFVDAVDDTRLSLWK